MSSSVERLHKAPDMWLSSPINHLDEANDDQETNTNFKGPEVRAEDMKPGKTLGRRESVVMGRSTDVS